MIARIELEEVIGIGVRFQRRWKLGYIHSASDVLLMPSRDEACGITQIFAMKYGVLPIVSKIDSFNNTAIDYNSVNENTKEETKEYVDKPYRASYLSANLLYFIIYTGSSSHFFAISIICRFQYCLTMKSQSLISKCILNPFPYIYTCPFFKQN